VFKGIQLENPSAFVSFGVKRNRKAKSITYSQKKLTLAKQQFTLILSPTNMVRLGSCLP